MFHSHQMKTAGTNFTIYYYANQSSFKKSLIQSINKKKVEDLRQYLYDWGTINYADYELARTSAEKGQGPEVAVNKPFATDNINNYKILMETIYERGTFKFVGNTMNAALFVQFDKKVPVNFIKFCDLTVVGNENSFNQKKLLVENEIKSLNHLQTQKDAKQYFILPESIMIGCQTHES